MINSSKVFNVPKSLVEVQRDYLIKICRGVEGLKCMILDKPTAELISLNFLQSEGFEMEVFLFEDIASIKEEKLTYVSAIYLINSTDKNLTALFEEIKNPNFKEYHIFFLNDVSDDIIRKLAENDQQDLIKNLQRIYFNYHAPNDEFFHSNVRSVGRLLSKRSDMWSPEEMEGLGRMEESMLSALCSLRKFPTIRYLRDSELSLQLADRLSAKLKKLAIAYPSDFERQKNLLIILERKEDPITPLLFHWNYQSLLHEILKIDCNKIKVSDKEYNLNLQHDEFYKNNLYSNYGDFILSLKTKVEALSAKRQQNKEIKNFEDMQKLLSQMPDIKKDTNVTVKHFALTDEITKYVNQHQLLEISKLEQEIASKDSRKEHFNMIIEFFARKDIHIYDKFRLTCLFCLKHEKSEQALSLQKLFEELKPTNEMVNQLSKILSRCGNAKRVQKAFGTYLGEKAFQMYKDFFTVV
jgi:vacuolar protein sorting-associated protein 45